MPEILRKWLHSSQQDAIEELQEFGMRERNEMAAQAQAFADWLALQNSRAING